MLADAETLGKPCPNQIDVVQERGGEELRMPDRNWATWIQLVLVANRNYISAIIHLIAFVLAYGLAFECRFDFDLPPDMVQLLWTTLPWVLFLKFLSFYMTGHLHGSWRYVSFADLMVLFRAVTLAVMAIGAIDYFFLSTSQIPRSVVLLDWVMCIVLFGGLRSAWRATQEQFWPIFNGTEHRSALIVGANDSGGALARQIHSAPQLKYRIVGFVDADPFKKGTRLGGIPVLGGLDEAVRLVEHHDAECLLVVAGSLSGKRLRRLMEQCQAAEVSLKVVPPISDLLSGDHCIRPRDVEINDLLRREPVELDSGAIAALVKGRCVMVTGAGGSIGSEICRQILQFAPKSLVLVERAENSLFSVEQSLARLRRDSRIVACIADVLDKRRMNEVFRAHRPEVVFHAAAHKHVPMMESNVGEAIKNNVIGTMTLADLADRYDVQNFVMISTDKAVNPRSIMGATKQMAERYVRALSTVSETKFVVVRFGNVLGSAGSVVPIFQEQIRRGGPVTITDPEMRRFFMTIPEASQLVLQAAAMGGGGEVFVLDMGELVKVIDLAHDIIRLSGLQPDDIEIKFTGLRPGEKLTEELHSSNEQLLPTRHPKVLVTYQAPCFLEDVRRAVAALCRAMRQSQEVARQALLRVVSEDSPHPPYSLPPMHSVEVAETVVHAQVVGVAS